MKADALSLVSLYSTVNKAYVVPDYQRPFAWSQERATDLLDAILDDAADKQEMTSIGTFLFCVVPTQDSHPFGDNSANSVAPRDVWEVVDGQQRLTVLALVGYALKQRHAALMREGLVYAPPLEFDMMYSNFKRVNGRRVPILVRDGDNFDSYVRSELGQTLGSFVSGTVTPSGTIADVLAKVMEWTNSLSASNFGKFCDYLLERCKYVQVVADTQDIAFTMFEPLNSTSEPLTAFEVFRSKAIRQLGSTQATFDKTLGYLSYENSRRDDVVKRSNQLVFSLAQSYSGERPRIQFVRLKKYLDPLVNDRFVASMESGAEFLGGVWNDQVVNAPWFDASTKDCVRFLKASNHLAPMPVLMRYYQHDPSLLPEVAKAIAAFWALWRSAFPTNKLPEVYRALLDKHNAHDMSIDRGKLMSVADFKSYLRGELERKISQTTGGVASSAWIARASGALNYEEHKAVCRFLIFIEMGASLRQNLAPDDPWTNLDDIEHILPAVTYPSPPELHRLGNLTFLPLEVNRSLRDLNWALKREAYEWLAMPTRMSAPPTVFTDGSAVPPGVIRYLGPGASALLHLSPLAANQTWSATEIAARTESMLKVVWESLYQDWLH
jgi:hypothetical protein